MPFQLFKNNAKSTLASSIVAGDATITVQTGHGARFPSPLAPDFCMATLDDGTNVEVVKVVARSSDSFTVLRAMEGTTANAFASGTKFELRATSGGLDWLKDFSNLGTLRNMPVTGTASLSIEGLPLPTAVCCVTAQTQNNSVYACAQPQISMRTATSASNPLHLRQTVPCVTGQRGFRAYFRIGFKTIVASQSLFLGLANTTGQVNSTHAPNSWINAVGIGFMGGIDATLRIFRNDGAGNAVETDLGSYFTVNSGTTIEFTLDQAPGDAGMFYAVRRLDISSIADVTGAFSTDLPPNSLWLNPYMHGFTTSNSTLEVRWLGWAVEPG